VSAVLLNQDFPNFLMLRAKLKLDETKTYIVYQMICYTGQDFRLFSQSNSLKVAKLAKRIYYPGSRFKNEKFV
jgi:hypothetical protein